MRTQAQSEASRSNGAQSHGPATEAGKTRSSQNALKLGLFSRCVVLANESQQQYDQFLERNRAEWDPQGESENQLLLEMVNAAWRLRRIWAAETAALDTEMFMQRPEFDSSFSSHHGAMRAADAILALTAQNPAALAAMHRAETTYSRAYRRAQDGLIRLQRLRAFTPAEPAPEALQPDPPPTPQQNEPKPEPHSLLQMLLALLLVLGSAMKQESRRPALRRNLPPGLAVEPETTFLQPETFHWESVFTPTNRRPSPDSRQWSYTQ